MIIPENLRNQRVLLSPLNWGMGHVARCIGLIDQLRRQGNTIIIACDDYQKQVFQEYFSDIKYMEHAGYPFYFGGKGKFGSDLIRARKQLLDRLLREREEVRRYVDDFSIDCVLSDHRYGFISTKVPSIFITHQLNLPVKWYEKFVDRWHRKLMNQFSFIWVMDDENSSLAGKLSENCPKIGCYIGHYSRFSLYTKHSEGSSQQVLIASGPRVYAEQLIVQALTDTGLRPDVIVHDSNIEIPSDVLSISGNWREKDQAILTAQTIVSRSGYSTLMDCKILQKDGIFIPTKGQAEQVYLANLWKKNSKR